MIDSRSNGMSHPPMAGPPLPRTNRQLFDPESERAILGTLLLDSTRFEEVAARVGSVDFQVAEHKTVFCAMEVLNAADKPVDLNLLIAELREQGKLKSIGGKEFLAELAQSIPSVANLSHYLDQVRDASNWRRIQAVMVDALAAAKAGDASSLAAALELAVDESVTVRGERQPELRTICAADIVPESLSWLWPARIPAGKLTLISGDPGLGKSILTLDIVARVTTGRDWPDGTPGVSAGDVLLLSAEDDLGDTIRPRLDAAGADLGRVHVVDIVRERGDDGVRERQFNLRRDIDRLEELLQAHPDCKLIIIDPLNAYMGGADTHRDAEVRGVLAPLTALAASTGVTVIAVSHLNKGERAAIYRTNGSIAYVAAARAAWIVVCDPDNAQRRLFLPVKANLGPETSGLAYYVEGDANGAAHVAWSEEPVTVSADDVLSHGSKRINNSAVDEFLCSALASGERTATELLEEAAAKGISEKALRTAAKRLNVEHRREGFGPGAIWYWQLPGTAVSIESA